jgi:hypothetical protein
MHEVPVPSSMHAWLAQEFWPIASQHLIDRPTDRFKVNSHNFEPTLLFFPPQLIENRVSTRPLIEYQRYNISCPTLLKLYPTAEHCLLEFLTRFTMNPAGPSFRSDRSGDPAPTPATNRGAGLENSMHNASNSKDVGPDVSGTNNTPGTDLGRSTHSRTGSVMGSSRRGTVSDGHQFKKRKRDNFDAAFATTIATQKLPTTHEEWFAKGPSRTGSPLSFPAVGSNIVIDQHRLKEASLLETADGRVNWYAMDPSRAVAQGLVWKVCADEQSIDAFANTLKALAKSGGANFVHIRTEVECPDQTIAHRRQLAVMAEESKARLAVEDKTKKVVTCANCKKPGHTSAICVVPNANYGCIKPCPYCNSTKHLLDYCSYTKGKLENKDTLTGMTNLLL